VSGDGHPAVFLDRDGVINALAPDERSGRPESPYRPEDVVILPGVSEAIDEIHEAGFALVVASNQPAAAKGMASEDALDAVHARVVELLGPSASSISEWRYCRHHPASQDPRLRECDCRKPKPGLLLDSARELRIDLGRSWIAGDADRDLAAGAAAGCRTVLIDHPDSAGRRTGSIEPDLQAADLPSAARAILQQPR
jgi:D-glycero-D-manno-heptose 1,7-bisphosphate phosphatase